MLVSMTAGLFSPTETRQSYWPTLANHIKVARPEEDNSSAVGTCNVIGWGTCDQLHCLLELFKSMSMSIHLSLFVTLRLGDAGMASAVSGNGRKREAVALAVGRG